MKDPTSRGEGVTKNQYRAGGLPKKEGLGQFANLRGVGKKGVVFLRGSWCPNAHYVKWEKYFEKKIVYFE